MFVSWVYFKKFLTVGRTLVVVAYLLVKASEGEDGFFVVFFATQAVVVSEDGFVVVSISFFFVFTQTE